MRTTAPGQSALLLLDAVALLVDEKVDYAVVGAMAASVHGVVRASFADAAASFAAARESLDMPLLRRLATRYGRDASAALEKLLVARPA